MINRKKSWGWGLALVGAAVACAPDIRELGDEPLGGAGGGTANKAGSSTTLPSGGSKAAPAGGGGNPPASAGSATNPVECYSPTHAELAQDPDAVGCPCEGEQRVCATTESDAAPGFACVDGRWSVLPGACEPGCFSPTNFARAHDPAAIGCECESDEPVCVDFGGNDAPARFECVAGRWKLSETGCIPCFSPTITPELALTPGVRGCTCSDEPPECVRTTHDDEPHDLALYCIEGRWTSAEDGVCDWLAPGRKVDDVSYPSGARRVPSPFSFCNECDCVNGELVNCTTDDCADTTCEPGSRPARRCLGCGPNDACSEYEIGCLSGEGCETGLCSSAWCG